MAYQIRLKKKAIKTLQDINEPYYSNLKAAIYKLANDPRPIGYKKLKGKDSYRIRVADYRIIYEIFDNVMLIEVIDVGHRKDIYD